MVTVRPAAMAGTPEHALYMQWSWFGEATFARPLGEIINHRRNFDPEIPEVVEEMASRALLCVKAVNDAVEEKSSCWANSPLQTSWLVTA